LKARLPRVPRTSPLRWVISSEPEIWSSAVGVDVLDADGLDDPKPNRRSIGPSSLSVVLAGPLTAPIPSNTVEVNSAPMMRDLMSMFFIGPKRKAILLYHKQILYCYVSCPYGLRHKPPISK
jgi:hypothetical protein